MIWPLCTAAGGVGPYGLGSGFPDWAWVALRIAKLARKGTIQLDDLIEPSNQARVVQPGSCIADAGQRPKMFISVILNHMRRATYVAFVQVAATRKILRCLRRFAQNSKKYTDSNFNMACKHKIVYHMKLTNDNL